MKSRDISFRKAQFEVLSAIVVGVSDPYQLLDKQYHIVIRCFTLQYFDDVSAWCDIMKRSH